MAVIPRRDPVTADLYDLVIVGSGVAGLSAAVPASRVHGLDVAIVTKGDLIDGTTRWAQGGVAAVMGDESEPDDTVALHLADTLAAGGGLCDADAVGVLVEEGPRRMHDLMALGASFDRDDDGTLELAREGGHSTARVVHAGGSATGAEIQRALTAATRAAPIDVFEHWFCCDLVIEAGRCVGVSAIGPDGTGMQFRAKHVLLASGGAGQLFAVTTNPSQATGDGTAMAMRAGVAVADVEFMQFHPTALHVPAMPRPLLTEALRGHGAVLRGPDGERFVDELLPRDVVSRAETAVMIDTGSDHVYLDATGLDHFGERFANIAADLAAVGLDPAVDLLPVAPAAHYLSGGAIVDLDGATELPGLWAAGEASCSGVHGANRLASNSLLEGLVFGPRVVEAIVRGKDAAEATGVMRAVLDPAGHLYGSADDEIIGGVVVEVPRYQGSEGPESTSSSDDELAKVRADLEHVMTFEAGVLRSAESLKRAADKLTEVRSLLGVPVTTAGRELRNLCTVGDALIRAASLRRESRGAHSRTDFPETDPEQRHRLVQRRDVTDGPAGSLI